MTDFNQYSNSLEETLKNSDLHNITSGLAEVILDNLIDDGIVKDIPIIGTFLALGNVAIGIKDRLFLKKIIYFISEVKDIPTSKRKKMIDGINNSDKFRTRVGEKLLFIIDRCEDHEKVKIIAKIFAAFIANDINYNDFLRSASIIDRIILDDLVWFIENNHDSVIFEELGDLVNSGLFDVRVEDQRDYDLNAREGYQLRADINDIGEKIKSILNK